MSLKKVLSQLFGTSKRNTKNEKTSSSKVEGTLLGSGFCDGTIMLLVRTDEGELMRQSLTGSLEPLTLLTEHHIALDSGEYERGFFLATPRINYLVLQKDAGYHIFRERSKGFVQYAELHEVPIDLEPFNVEGNRHMFVSSGTTLYEFTLRKKGGRMTASIKERIQQSVIPRFPHSSISLLGATKTGEGLSVYYKAPQSIGSREMMQIGAVLYDEEFTHKKRESKEVPLLKLQSTRLHTATPLGVIQEGGVEQIYVLHGIHVKRFNHPDPFSYFGKERNLKLNLKRYRGNPIISPRDMYRFEQHGTFNPAVVQLGGKVHMLYRALGPDGISSLGYAASENGYDFEERHDAPAYIPRHWFDGAHTELPPTTRYSHDLYHSGGGWGGCEDPKMVAIDGQVHLTYVAFNGWAPQRVAHSTISEEDFLAHRFEYWSAAQLISAPNMVSKSGGLFPQKIGDMFAFFHRVFPHIYLDFFSDLDFSPATKWLGTHIPIETRPGYWDSRKISVAAPPIETDEGWLVLYNGTDDRHDGLYQVGAMLLDKDNPSNVIARTNYPILTPEEWYEHDGKPGVIYPCGAAVIDDTLFVYYGAGDTHVAVATAKLRTFVRELMNEQPL